jgi:type I restriction-modification system DNA methylase subunit
VKKSLRKNIDRLEWDLIKVTLEVQGNEEALKKLELYKKNQAKPFFLWKLYFAEVFQRDNPGFDVVIANPPYIQLQKIKEESDKLEKEKYHTFTKTGDIYCLFYEQGIRILNNHGTLTFISSNTWMRAKFGEKLRNFFVKESNPQLIINFEDKQIFSSATVETCITIIRKEALTNGLNAVSLKRDILEFGYSKRFIF